jgi:hypothetical protein
MSFGFVGLREVHRLKMVVKRVLRRISEPKRKEVTGGWRRLCNEEILIFYSMTNIIKIIKSRRPRRVGHVAHMGDVYKILVGKPEGKRLYGRQ